MIRILVIDDEKVIRNSLSEMLSLSGFEVRTAANGNEGIRLMDQVPADLVITDIVIPKQEGLETILQLRRYHPQAKIIAISCSGVGAGRTYLQAAHAMGAERTLSKPFSFRDLIETIDEILGTTMQSHPQSSPHPERKQS